MVNYMSTLQDCDACLDALGVFLDTIHSAPLIWWRRSWEAQRWNQIFEVQLLGAPSRAPEPGETQGWPSRAFLYWCITSIPTPLKKLNYSTKAFCIWRTCSQSSKTAAKISVMNVTYVVLSLCLARDKKNRSKAK